MGNTRSTQMRSQLNQAQRVIATLRQEKKQMEERANKTTQFHVVATRFRLGATNFENPTPINLTFTYITGQSPSSTHTKTLSQPLELMAESVARKLSLTEEKLAKNAQEVYIVYGGLTDPTASQVNMRRPVYAAQPQLMHIPLVFVAKIQLINNVPVPQNMSERDVAWVQTHLKVPNQHIDVPKPYYEEAALYTRQDDINPPETSPSTMGFRGKSAYSLDQMHFYQVNNR